MKNLILAFLLCGLYPELCILFFVLLPGVFFSQFPEFIFIVPVAPILMEVIVFEALTLIEFQFGGSHVVTSSLFFGECCEMRFLNLLVKY